MPPGGRGEPLVLVVEDHELLAETLVLALRARGRRADRPGSATFDQGSARLLAEVLRRRPEIVLLDLGLGVADGEELIRPLARAGIRVVVVTATTDRSRWGGCLREGARIVVAKHRPLPELMEVVDRLAAGQPVLPETTYAELLGLWHRDRADQEDVRHRLASLTPRERQVLDELLDGHTIREIAGRGQVSVATVRTQVRAILHKLGVSTQVAAIGLAHRAGWHAVAS